MNTRHAGGLSPDLSADDLRTFFEVSLDLICITDLTGRIQYINPAWERTLGHRRREMLHRQILEIVHPDDRAASQDALATLLAGNDIAYFENRCIDAHGDYHTLIWTAPGRRPGVPMLYATARDRTDRRRVDALLRESEERYRIVVESSGQLIYDYDIDTGAITWTGAVETITGWTPEEFRSMDIRRWEENIHPDDRRRAMSLLENAMQQGSMYCVQYRFRHRDGHYLDIEDTGVILNNDTGTTRRMIGSMKDITAVRQYERSLMESETRLRASLHEKEVLLREIHHRVKNNLQIISSLLTLQSSQIDDARSREQFRDSRNRIRSMALIHEQLYRTDDLAGINVAAYLHQLTTNLWRSYGMATAVIATEGLDPHISVDIDTAIPCGLIVNELVSNAIKYAFADGRTGTIAVSFTQQDDRYTLAIADDGAGLPDSVDPATAPTLGLQLVHALVAQIDGTMTIERTGGTRFSIVFPASADT